VHRLVKLIEAESVAARVEELGREISDDFRDEQIALVTVLKGGVFFLADLARTIDVPVELDFVSAHSYEGDRSSGTIRLEKPPALDLKGKKVVLVEDIIDTGRTCAFLEELILKQEPDVFKVCTLLDKPANRLVAIALDYVGFTIEDRFVVGYGLDYMEKYRNLDDIYVLEQDTDAP
jgi:hypoxanthine phosphoribosyltransferase